MKQLFSKLYLILYGVLAIVVTQTMAASTFCGSKNDPAYNNKATNYELHVTNKFEQPLIVSANDAGEQVEIQRSTKKCSHRVVVPFGTNNSYTKTHDIFMNGVKICNVTTSWYSYPIKDHYGRVSSQLIRMMLDQPKIINYVENAKCRVSPETITNAGRDAFNGLNATDLVVKVTVDKTDRPSAPDWCLVRNAPDRVEAGTNYEAHVINALDKPLPLVVDGESVSIGLRKCVHRTVVVRGAKLLNEHFDVERKHSVTLFGRAVCDVTVKWQSVLAFAKPFPTTQAVVVGNDVIKIIPHQNEIICKATHSVSLHNNSHFSQNWRKNDLLVNITVEENKQ